MMTICTGSPPVEPGSGGSWKAKMLLPSIWLTIDCMSAWIWLAERLRSCQSTKSTPPMLLDTPSEPLMSQRPLCSGSVAMTSSHFLPNFST